MRFGHNDTYGIEQSQAKSIPLVSDLLLRCLYAIEMAKSSEWKSWGERLKYHLKASGSSLAKLAERMPNRDGEPMAESTLRSWTNGTRRINLEDFFELCRRAEADPAVILFGHPVMTDNLKQQLGHLAATVFDRDPTKNPDYATMMANIRSPKRKSKV